MSFRDYIGTKAVTLCMMGIGGLYLALIGHFLQISPVLIFLFFLGGSAIIVIWLYCGWRAADRRIRMLRGRLAALTEKYLIGETLDRPTDAVELEYYFMMQEISRAAIGAVERARMEKQDYCDYVERWIHELKTPLTACSLILSNGGETGKLRRELRRADNLTDTILTYAKLRTAEKDTQIVRIGLRAVCDQAVWEEMELLIASGIAVCIDGDSEVYTDSKLLVFILKQLLINCAKYCGGCRVHMILSEGGLCFEDNGPGIPRHELERVTERGFTGAAGRKQGQSTGMGLYIVSQICQKLNIELGIYSEEGRYTRFEFRFPAPILQNC